MDRWGLLTYSWSCVQSPERWVDLSGIWKRKQYSSLTYEMISFYATEGNYKENISISFKVVSVIPGQSLALFARYQFACKIFCVWNSLKCYPAKNYQKKNLTPKMYLLITVKETCPAAFEKFNSTCYYVNVNVQVNHDGAVSFCTGQDENAHLASILVRIGSKSIFLKLNWMVNLVKTNGPREIFETNVLSRLRKRQCSLTNWPEIKIPTRTEYIG